MQIVVTHLTRMQPGFMCTAGIDLDTGLHVRPMLDRQMPIEMLAVHGGLFEIGQIVDLGETRFVGRVPEVEDRHFDPTRAHRDGEMPVDQLCELLEQHADEKLGAIFGPDLERVGSTCVVEETGGLRSLGCYWAQSGKLFLDDHDTSPRIRFAFRGGEFDFTVPVTDIRLFEADHVTPCSAQVNDVAQQVAELPRVLVSVGLSRPYRKMHDDPPRHWFQINNFHLPDREDWTLAEALSSVEI